MYCPAKGLDSLLLMMQRWFFLVFFFAHTALALARQANRIPVFEAGKDGYASYRIPAIIRTPQGMLLAFCEGRRNGAADFGQIDIVLKKSKDGGKTWSSLQVVVKGQPQAGNPAPVFDQTDPLYPGGRVLLFYNTGDNHEGEVRKHKGLREVFYTGSTDGGEHWQEPVNITLQVHRPFFPERNPAYTFTKDWRSYANTPGHALQIPTGPYSGRIFVAANHSSGAPLAHFEDYQSHGFYTDDHCRSFRLSETIAFAGSNEATAAFLGGSTLIMNMRNQKGQPRQRLIARSSDGGSTWDTVYADPALPDPVCEGSLLNIEQKKGRMLLAFSNAADTLQRNHLTVRISNDGGKHWDRSWQIESCNVPKSKDCIAYSDITLVKRKRLGILYEREDYRQIVFTTLRF